MGWEMCVRDSGVGEIDFVVGFVGVGDGIV